MKKTIYSMVILVFCFLTIGCSSDSNPRVTITEMDNYFDVRVDYSGSVSRYNIGKEYAENTLEIVPDYESIVDSYFVELVVSLEYAYGVTYEDLISRVQLLAPQLDSSYSDEIDGFASQLSGGDTDVLGDGKLSTHEFMILNFMPDVSTGDVCSAISVFGDMSSTGSTIVGRNMDWFIGSTGDIAKLNAISFLTSGSNKIISIGYLGMLGVVTGINNDGIYIANLYSQTDAPYTADGKRPALFDIRTALETKSSIAGAGEFMGDPDRVYAYDDLMFIADANEARVLENNFAYHRELRSYDSILNPGVTWGFDNAISAVNAFALYGNYDNLTTRASNQDRWNNFKTELTSKGQPVSVEDVKQIMTYHEPGGTGDGDIYHTGTAQSIIYSFSDNSMQVFFHPITGSFTEDPEFITIETGW